MTVGEAIVAHVNAKAQAEGKILDPSDYAARIGNVISHVWPELWWATLITNDPADDHGLQIAVIEPLTKKEPS